jgi:hypothetical protein
MSTKTYSLTVYDSNMNFVDGPICFLNTLGNYTESNNCNFYGGNVCYPNLVVPISKYLFNGGQPNYYCPIFMMNPFLYCGDANQNFCSSISLISGQTYDRNRTSPRGYYQNFMHT